MTTATKVPTSDYYNQYSYWANSDGYGANYTKVDEGATPVDTDYNVLQVGGASVSTGYQLFGFTAFSVPTGATSIYLTMYIRGQITDPSSIGYASTYYKGVIRCGGTDYYTSDYTNLDSYTTNNFSWNPNNPKTASAWTVATINGGTNGLQYFGMYGSVQYSEDPYGFTYADVSNVYLLATYTDPPSGTTIKCGGGGGASSMGGPVGTGLACKRSGQWRRGTYLWQPV